MAQKFRKYRWELFWAAWRFTNASRNAWRELVNPDTRDGHWPRSPQTTKTSRA
jgi:hypothetical protein